MLPLPSSCEGCPFYKYRNAKGNGFVPDTIIPNSKVMFILQGPGKDEVYGQLLINRTWKYGKSDDVFESVKPAPLLGATGKAFDERYLPMSGLQRSEVSLGNAIRCRPGTGITGLKANDLPNITSTMKLETSKAEVVQALRFCRDTHLKVPESVTTIVAMGRYAMFQLTGIQNEESEYGHKQGVMESWRGFGVDVPSFTHFNTVDVTHYHPLHSEKRIFFMLHIASLFEERGKKFVHATLQDFHKLGRLLQGEWPIHEPTWLTTPPLIWPSYASFDTEYNPENHNELIRWSLCDKEGHLYCVERDATFDGRIAVQPGSVVLGQNLLADLRHLRQVIDVSEVRFEDLMLAHSVLWTGEPHNLNYIQSVYGTLNKYKHLDKFDPGKYSAFDSWEPMQIWKYGICKDFREDPLSWKVYRTYRIGLIDIIEESEEHGVNLHGDRLVEIQEILEKRVAGYVDEARLVTNNPEFKLGGKNDMMQALYSIVPKVKKVKVSKKREKRQLELI